MNHFKKDTILQNIIELLDDITGDWDMDTDNPINPDTKLISDLSFESIDVVQFIAGIEDKFRSRKLPFEKLVMKDGRYVDEITLNDTVDFLYQHLNQTTREN